MRRPTFTGQKGDKFTDGLLDGLFGFLGYFGIGWQHPLHNTGHIGDGDVSILLCPQLKEMATGVKVFIPNRVSGKLTVPFSKAGTPNSDASVLVFADGAGEGGPELLLLLMLLLLDDVDGGCKEVAAVAAAAPVGNAAF